MQEINKVLSKWNKKTELASHKIDLNKVDDIRAIVKLSREVAADAIATAKDFEKEFQTAKKRVEQMHQIVTENRKKVSNQLSDLQKIADDIGMELPRDVTGLYDEMTELGNSVPLTNLNNVFPI